MTFAAESNGWRIRDGRLTVSVPVRAERGPALAEAIAQVQRVLKQLEHMAESEAKA